MLTMEYKDSDSEEEIQICINSDEEAVANGYDADADTMDDDTTVDGDDAAGAADNSKDVTENPDVDSYVVFM